MTKIVVRCTARRAACTDGCVETVTGESCLMRFQIFLHSPAPSSQAQDPAAAQVERQWLTRVLLKLASWRADALSSIVTSLFFREIRNLDSLVEWVKF